MGVIGCNMHELSLGNQTSLWCAYVANGGIFRAFCVQRDLVNGQEECSPLYSQVCSKGTLYPPCTCQDWGSCLPKVVLAAWGTTFAWPWPCLRNDRHLTTNLWSSSEWHHAARASCSRGGCLGTFWAPRLQDLLTFIFATLLCPLRELSMPLWLTGKKKNSVHTLCEALEDSPKEAPIGSCRFAAHIKGFIEGENHLLLEKINQKTPVNYIHSWA